MEIVIFRKLGLDHRFCRELVDSIAPLRVWAQGSEAERLPPIWVGSESPSGTNRRPQSHLK